MKQALINKLQDKSAVIGVAGLGYVGLPLVLRFAEVGYRVIGLDIDSRKTERLNLGQSYIEHIAHEDVAKAKASGFEATTDFERASGRDGRFR